MSYSTASWEKLKKVHPNLRLIFELANAHWPHTIIYGARTLEEQTILVETGFSKTMNSKHLIQPDGFAHAVDAMPDPIDWKDKERILYFAGFVLGIAASRGIAVRHGGDWNQNRQFKDESFFDGAHIELMEVT
jgi:peptidoglycan LD-endopeptidase CwlK